jgi:hypothetical protein
MPKIPATALCLLLAAGANVQAQQPGMLMPPGVVPPKEDGQYYIEVLRNVIGIIRYCQSSGYLEPAQANEAVAVVKGSLDLLTRGRESTPEQTEAADAAEKKGAAGKTGPASTDIGENAKQMDTTVAHECRIMHARMTGSIVADEEDYKRALQDVYKDVRNKIGVTHYCREQGHIPPAKADEVSASLRSGISWEQTPGEIASGNVAEKEGTAGKFGLSPPLIDLVEMVPKAAADMCETLVSKFAEE